MFSQDQITVAARTQLDNNINLFNVFASTAFTSAKKIMDLNMSAAEASLAELTTIGQQLTDVKDPQGFTSLAAAQAQPSADKAVAYSRHLAGILTETQSEFTKVAEAQIAENSRKVTTLIDEVSKNAPPGSENVIAMLKSVVGNANAGYEQLAKSTKQAVETLETNLNTAAKQFTQAAEKTTRTSKK